MNEDINHRFEYHPPKDEFIKTQHEDVRAACKYVAEYFADTLPEGREKSLAITKLEESMMWANAAIARRQEVTFDSLLKKSYIGPSE